jgi:glycosyltransferase involved in cell wall biosynthesis
MNYIEITLTACEPVDQNVEIISAYLSEFGFEGVDLPCIPNAGGFVTLDKFDSTQASERKNVAAKAYGGQFGRGDIVIESIRLAFNVVPHFTAFLYSVTDDLLQEVIDLTRQFPGRVEFSSRKNPLSQSEMNELFNRSRIYLGASRSDGISTSFLEALNFGCYPIQTDTSCAGDWEKLGAVASIVPQNVSIVTDELIRSLTDDELVDSAQIQNMEVSKQHLSFEKVRSIATTFYN